MIDDRKAVLDRQIAFSKYVLRCACFGVLALLVLLFLLIQKATAAEPVRLCTGSLNGVYFAAGEQIRSVAKNVMPVANVATEGTMDNLERLQLQNSDERSCNAMIGQPDGPAYLARTAPAKVGKLRQIAKLHREYLHVLCNKSAGVSDLSDVIDQPKKYRIAIGENGSGSWLIWQNFIAQNSKYGDVPVTNEGGVLALSAVAAGDATCALVPSGLRHGTVMEALTVYGDAVVLVGATDKRFDDAKDFKGEKLYETREFPKDAYPSSFHSNYFYDTETITWNAAVYVDTDDTDAEALTNLVKAVSRAALIIKAEYGN